MENLIKDECIVIKKTPVGERDLSVLVFFKKQGKENIYIPKGQLIKSFFPTATEPLNWFKGVFYIKRNKVYIKEIDSFKNIAFSISKDIEKFYTGFFILDTFNRFVLFQDEKMFILLKKSIYYLQNTRNVQKFKVNFLAKLTYLSGIYPVLNRCIKCKKGINGKNFGALLPEEEGVICKNCFQDRGSFLSFRDVKYLKLLKSLTFPKLEETDIQNTTSIEKFFRIYLTKHISR